MNFDYSICISIKIGAPGWDKILIAVNYSNSAFQKQALAQILIFQPICVFSYSTN